jgi:hypothetical protein
MSVDNALVEHVMSTIDPQSVKNIPMINTSLSFVCIDATSAAGPALMIAPA